MESNSANGSPASDSGNHACLDGSMKVIIDTDPGIGALPSPPLLPDVHSLMFRSSFRSFCLSSIFSVYSLRTCGIHVFNLVADDSMTILMAFQLPEIEILGLTTIFGNVGTEDATRNALLLEKSQVLLILFMDLMGLAIYFYRHRWEKMDKNASEFLVEMVSQYPGDVTILALGPLTNLALAIKRDPCFASKVKKIVILGGAFFTAGNVNPAAEANIYGDPEAADIVFTCGADITVVGINITTQVKFTGIFLHDPVSFAALVRPDLFTFKKGVVRVETQGICMGHTLMDDGLKEWITSNPWTGYSPASVAWTVDVPGVLSFIKQLLTKP
ncbi:Inosine-uridine preferring nucleoside hydrolase [Musa troglodytarum]|uniref:Inosine-uridine preferring nucleoside hydrolase n=1 Tax=Musa troglodytarum TaxID=320322 RepID=A0A9E7JJU5_9LILI|nr:Inosine-uridine preferring nucleoside hydrolase [Musa troglodytarum]